MKPLTVKLPEELVAKLHLAARQSKLSRSEVVRLALSTYLNGQTTADKGSLLELADHLIGSLAGPGDLSSNPKYMEDFGR